MKVLVQRVSEAHVEVDQNIISSIKHGFLLYVCFESEDNIEKIDHAIYRISKLRIFEDLKGKMNDNIIDVKGSILSVSQFTLSWDGSKGHRPSFDLAMPPQQAKIFYKLFNDKLKEQGIEVQAGVFGADMQVHSTNDGPVTFHLSF